jgi:hypothetical protein
MANNVLTDTLLEPLNGATTVKVNINAGTGNLAIDKLTDSEQVLASGTLEYLEKQGPPPRTLKTSNGQTTLTVTGEGARRSRFRFPWEVCNGETEWRIHLNPTVSSDITAHSDGGNVKLDLAGMVVTHVSADTGGGNMDVVLPDSVLNLSVAARTGAGNVVVHVPSGIAARIHASTGLGKVIMDPEFGRIDDNTYQSTNYDGAANRVEMTVSSGVGNVSVSTK